jgi:hypothetical protein
MGYKAEYGEYIGKEIEKQVKKSPVRQEYTKTPPFRCFQDTFCAISGG